MAREFVLSSRFKRALSKKPPQMQAAVLDCLRRLADDPKYPGLRVHKMQGVDKVWEAYVDGANRVTFEYIDEGGISFRMNCNHDMLYRNP